jgi:hypothetical protein
MVKTDIELPAYVVGDDRLDDDDFDDHDAVEFAGLISKRNHLDNNVVPFGLRQTRLDELRIPLRGKSAHRLLAIIFCVILIIAVTRHRDGGNGGEVQHKPVHLVCPSTVEKSGNDKGGDEFELYVADDKMHENKTLEEFRTMNLDGWGIKFQEVKAMLTPWKEEMFVPNIESGNSIYESACGIGMNLLISIEILREHNITDITVSGNDYVGDSVAIANRIWGDDEAKRLANKGTFCQADSTHLGHIPDDSFDFVYTGYIDPIVDPLSISPPNTSVDEKWTDAVSRCKSKDEKNLSLTQKEQEKQNKWHANWVTELIRIVKPGKLLAIENGAESLCTNPDDWGGVDKSWWAGAIELHGWDVDPDSLIIRDEKIIPGGHWGDTRYHVALRKNEK